MGGDDLRDAGLSFDSASEEDTVGLGEALGARLRPGDVVFAEGPLGAGKTCFIRGVCAGLGFRGKVRSPSFAIVNRYEGRVPIYHVDLYRIPDDSPELEDLSREECFSEDAVTLVEWGGKLRAWGVEPSAVVTVELAGDGRRRIVVEAAAGAADRIAGLRPS